MLLLTLLAISLLAIVGGIFVFALRNTVDGIENEAGFHHVGRSESTSKSTSIEAHARAARS